MIKHVLFSLVAYKNPESTPGQLSGGQRLQGFLVVVVVGLLASVLSASPAQADATAVSPAPNSNSAVVGIPGGYSEPRAEAGPTPRVDPVPPIVPVPPVDPVPPLVPVPPFVPGVIATVFDDLAVVRESAVPGLVDGNLQRFIYAIPKNHPRGEPYTAVLFVHGANGDRFDAMTTTAVSSNRALLANGYLLISGDYGSRESFGNSASIAALGRIARLMTHRMRISSVVVESASMGGLTGLNAIIQRKVPRLQGWIGINPVCNLQAARANPILGPLASQAYLTSSELKLKEYDPARTKKVKRLKGLRMLFLASDADEIVARTENTTVCERLFSLAGAIVTSISVPGLHGDAQSFQVSSMLRFLGKLPTVTLPRQKHKLPLP